MADEQNGHGLLVVAQLDRNFGRGQPGHRRRGRGRDGRAGVDCLVRVRVTTGQDSAGAQPVAGITARPSRSPWFSTASGFGISAGSAVYPRKNSPGRPS